MALHPVDRALCRLLLCVFFLSATLGCEVIVGVVLQGAAARDRASTPVPFEKTPWVADGRISNLGLLVHREGTLEARFVRDQGFPPVSMLVSIDGALVAEFWEKEALALWLSPGRHRISCLSRIRPDKQVPLLAVASRDSTKSTDLELDLTPGPVPCIRISIIGDEPKLTSLVPAGSPPSRGQAKVTAGVAAGSWPPG